MSRDLAFLGANQEKAPHLFREVQKQSSRALADAGAVITALIERLPSLDRLANAWAGDMPGREMVMARLEERGIPLRPYFVPIHWQTFYMQKYGYARGDFPVTEQAGESSLALPFSSVMTETQVDYVCETLKTAP